MTLMGGITQGNNGLCGGAEIGSGNSASSDYGNTGWATNLTGTSWTISFWTSNITSSSNLFYIFGDATAGSFRCFTNGVAGPNNWILRGTGITDVYVNGGATVAPHLTTYVYDMSTNNIYGYLDGILVSTVAQGTPSITGSGPFKVMGYASNVGSPAGGLLDEFRVYSRALSAAEVAALVNLTSYDTVSVTACDSYISPSGTQTWVASGTYNDTVANMAGCDSVITINLTINYSSTSTINPVACDMFYSPSLTKIYTTSGIYLDTIPNTAGCDSFITINLTVNHSTSSTINPVACRIYTSPSGGSQWFTSGTYHDVIPNSLGCDSNITINLTVNQPSASRLSFVVCDSFVGPRGETLTATGIYNDTITNSVGCDSAIQILLTVNHSSRSTTNPVACDSYTSPSGRYTWTTSGTYHDTIQNLVLCDSFMTINLTVNRSSSSTVDTTVCDVLTSPSGNFHWATSGTYQDIITNSAGCDSTITFHLVIKNSTQSSISPVVCNSYTTPSGNHTYTTSGLYNDVIPNAVGCDSFISIQLTVNYSSSSTINPVACGSYTTPSGNHTYTASGTYHDTVPSAAGCDSAITIVLTVDTVNTAVTVTGNTLMAISTGVFYQWINCDSGTIITGAINQAYTATTNGNYAVIVTHNSCEDTSQCYPITGLGIAENKELAQSIKLFPNPGTGYYTISSSVVLDNADIKIITSAGQVVMEKTSGTGSTFTFDISELASGIYICQVSAAGNTARIMLVKN
jgi:Concanavalin A-like lectin/glucanases superfamily/Secretion system C-terminal sorting domain